MLCRYGVRLSLCSPDAEFPGYCKQDLLSSLPFELIWTKETSEIIAESTLRAPVVPLALEEDKTSLCKAGCMLPSAVRLQPEYLPAPLESLNVPV